MTSMTIKEEYDKIVTWKPTTLKGLKGIPTLSHNWDGADYIPSLPFNWLPIIEGGNGQFSVKNKETLVELIKSKPDAELFVEIGTASIFTGSSTETFILNKKDNTSFISIDRAVCSNQTLEKTNVHFITNKSTNDYIKEYIGNKKIDILFIDGDHSVKTVFEEYEFYLPLMKQDGVIVLHDTNMHPGPFLFMEAVDETVFRKEKKHLEDLGLGIVYLQ